MGRIVQIAVIGVLVLVFAASGLAKLTGPATFVDMFARFGLPAWFVVVTAAVELVGAALLASFDDVWRRSGAAMLSVAMAVAAALHAVHDPLAMALPAFALMLLAGYVAAVPLREAAARGPADA